MDFNNCLPMICEYLVRNSDFAFYCNRMMLCTSVSQYAGLMNQIMEDNRLSLQDKERLILLYFLYFNEANLEER